jgi:hypothetical protein
VKQESVERRTFLVSCEARDGLVAASCVLVVLVFYLWLASVGTWTRFPYSISYHGQLAQAFLRGQLAFLEEPDPALLALSDPYDAAQLQTVPYPLDFSFYKGKFYAYFGPVPALLLAPFQLLTKTPIPDRYPSFAFICGLLVVNALLVLRIRKHYFGQIGTWTVAAGILTVGLAAPIGFMLDFEGYYATAAVMGGAFFFMAGLLAAFDALSTGVIRPAGLALAGTLWIAAVCTRITHVVSVVLVAVFLSAVVFAVERQRARPKTALRSILALAVPLVLGGACLAWYNYARFGSPFETGLRYQLNPQSMEKLFRAQSGGMFSPLYLVQNLFNYLLNPFSPHGVFPYADLRAPWIESVIPGFPLPARYTPEWMTGLLWAAPFVVFAAWTVGLAVRGRLVSAETGRLELRGIVTALWLAFAGGAVVILSFFWAAERYVPDFVFPLYVLAVIGFWQCGRGLSRTSLGRTLYILLGVGLIGFTILISNLLALGQAKVQFELLNPGAWGRLQSLAGGDLRRFHPELWQQLRTLLGQ